MLKLKKVELLGFKSFCERTEMHFNGDGIVGIVGPNGCGKSNISDAVSWVLGEQSARLLRGTRMEDVIFNGTRDRKPLGMASVTLTLIDPEAYSQGEPEQPEAPAAAVSAQAAGIPPNGSAPARRRAGERPGEIIVTRRLFRSGESEYLLNGRLCRLRDIQDIFMGTGLGPESYAIIEQGRIGQILSSRPHDRRAVIEEAAGITRFKTKKKLAEAKLESARQNLARVNDILEEVSRQVNSLKRQAAKARRYEELRAEMNAKLAVVLASRHRAMERLAVQAALDLNLAAEEFRSCNARVEQLEADYGAVQKESFDLESQLQQSREASSAAAREAERTQQKIDYQARMAEENRARIGQAEAEIAKIESRLEELQKEIAAERGAVDRVSAESSGVRRQIEAGASELDGIQSRIRQREQEQEELRQRVIRLLGQASTLRNQLAQIDEFLAGLERQSARARSEEAAANEEISAVSAQRNSHLARLREQQSQLESLDESRRRLEASLAEAQQQAQARRERVQLLKEEISRIQARRESLEEILSHRAYTTETVKSLFAAMDQGRMDGFRPLGIFADFIEVDAEYEKAVEGFLREELDYVVVSNWEEAERGMRLLRSEMEGHATFLVSSGAQPEAGAGDAQTSLLASQPGVRGPLRAHVRLNNGVSHAASALLPRLDRCYLTENEETARHLAGQHPDLYFLLPEGLCYHGCSLSGGRKTSSGPLALKRELREIMPRLAAAMQQLEADSAALNQAETQIASQTAALEALRQEMQNREKGALASEHELRQIHDRLHRANARLSAARLEIDRFRQKSEQAAVEAERCRNQAADLENQQREAEQMLAAVRLAIAEDQARAAKAAERLSECRAQLAALEERKKAAEAAAARLEQTFAGEARRRSEMGQQIGAWAAECERLLQENRDLQEQMQSAAARQCALQQEGRNLEAALNQRRSRMAEIEESLKAARQQLEAARDRRSTIEIQLVRLQSDLKHLEETCLRELGRPVAEIAESAEAPLAGSELEAAEQECSSLRTKIEALGPVNVLALEEYQEAQQRQEFLDTQRKDLFESIRDTQQAIGEIDSVSRKQFLDAFERINENFRKTFSTLFGGGLGEMRLTDETNIAESGIDIVASPPGKRLQNVLLLSGGEKALTAIALLMAVFQYQPSPFCILDEVDAPLDEANIVRFTRLIRQMSQQTQFILITHSKTTMEVAQALYGVTMQEPGVSRLVSVRFGEKAEKAIRPLVPPPARGMGNVARV